MMTIYDWHTGPYPARVRIALGELGLQPKVRFVSIDLWKGEHKTPAFLTKNYSGTLPVLELDDGTLIAECTAITQYLDALDGRPSLTGTTPLQQGVIHMMSKRAEIELLDAVSVYFHHATPGLGPDVELYQNEEWGLRQRDKAVRGMRYFDGVLRRPGFRCWRQLLNGRHHCYRRLDFRGTRRPRSTSRIQGPARLVRANAGASQRWESDYDV